MREALIYTVIDGWQLDNTIQTKVLAMVFSMASEIERELVSKRTRESLTLKKLVGVKVGRPRGPGNSRLYEFKPEIFIDSVLLKINALA